MDWIDQSLTGAQQHNPQAKPPAQSQPAFDEADFQRWYADIAKKTGLDPNPDDPRHQYDYRAAFRAGATPAVDPKDHRYHWPSQFKADGHPHRYVEQGGQWQDTRADAPPSSTWIDGALAKPAPKPEEERPGILGEVGRAIGRGFTAGGKNLLINAPEALIHLHENLPWWMGGLAGAYREFAPGGKEQWDKFKKSFEEDYAKPGREEYAIAEDFWKSKDTKHVNDPFFTKLRHDPFRTLSVGLAENAPQLLITIGASAVNPAVGLAVAGSEEGGAAWEDAKKDGASDKDAAYAAGLTALPNMFLEYFPAGKYAQKLFKGVPKAEMAGVFRGILKQAAAEGSTEFLQEMNGTFAKLLTYAGDKGFTWKDFKSAFSWENLQQYGAAGLYGAILGGTLHGIGGHGHGQNEHATTTDPKLNAPKQSAPQAAENPLQGVRINVREQILEAEARDAAAKAKDSKPATSPQQSPEQLALPAQAQDGQKQARVIKFPPKEVQESDASPKAQQPPTSPQADDAARAAEETQAPQPATEEAAPAEAPRQAPAHGQTPGTSTDSQPSESPRFEVGSKSKAYTERGREIEFHYAVTDARDLVTSHDERMAPNPNYPQEVQPRDRTRAASEAQVSRIENNLNPELLGESAKVGDGAPIVGSDGVVESGNARSIGIKRAYARDSERAAGYRNWLRENADRFGLTPEQTDSIERPVLVRVRQTEVDRAEFGREANESAVASMSATERAKSDAQRLTPAVIESLQVPESGDVNWSSNRDFVHGFMSEVIPANEHGAMFDDRGAVSVEGQTRMRNAVLAKAYGDADAIAKLIEHSDNNVRNVGSALMREAPRIVQLRTAMEAGSLHDLDISSDLTSALRKLSALREGGKKVGDYLHQNEMFGQELTPEARELLGVFDSKARSSRAIGDVLHRYGDLVESLGDPRQQGLFGAKEAPSKLEMLKEAIRTASSQSELPVADTVVPFEPGEKKVATAGARRPRLEVRDSGAEKPHLPLADSEPAEAPNRAAASEQAEPSAPEPTPAPAKEEPPPPSLPSKARDRGGSSGEAGFIRVGSAAVPVLKWMRRHFTKTGLLPKVVFEAKVARDGRLGARLTRIDALARDMGSLMRRYKGPLSREQLARYLDDAFRGMNLRTGGDDLDERQIARIARNRGLKVEDVKEATSRTIPVKDAGLKQAPEFIPIVRELRQQVDAMTRDLRRQGLLDDSVAKELERHYGQYVHRQYEAIRDERWLARIKEQPLWERAYELTQAKFPNKSQAEILGMLDAYVDRAGGPGRVILPGGTPEGAKDLSELRQRGDIEDLRRLLLGEVRHVEPNFFTTAAKMATLIEQQKFLEEMAAKGKGKFLFERPVEVEGTAFSKQIDTHERNFIKKIDKGLDTEPPGLDRLVVRRSSGRESPVGDLYTSRDIMDELYKIYDDDTLPRWLAPYMWANVMVKAGKTVGSVQATNRNFISNFLYVMAQGVNPLDPKAFLNAGKISYPKVFGSTNREMLARYEEYVRLGLFDQGTDLGDLKRMERAAQRPQGVPEKIGDQARMLKRGGRFLAELYQAPDNFSKAYVFEKLLPQYRKAFPNLTEEQVKQRLASTLRDTMQNYSSLPRGVRTLSSHVPVVAPFLSFSSELARNLKNIAVLSKEELKSNNPELRKIAAKRVAGTIAALSLPAVTKHLISWLFNTDPEDEDNARRFVAPWSKQADLTVWRGSKPGTVSYFDWGFIDVFSQLKQPFVALARGDFDGAMDALDRPFGEEILFGGVEDIRANKGPTGQPIYNPEDTFLARQRDKAAYLWKVGVPGTALTAQRIYEALKDPDRTGGQRRVLWQELVALGGPRIATIDLNKALFFKGKSYSDSVTNSRWLELKPGLREGDPGNGTAKAEKRLRELVGDLIHDIDAARHFEVDDEDIAASLKSAGVGKWESRALLDGDADTIVEHWMDLNRKRMDKAADEEEN